MGTCLWEDKPLTVRQDADFATSLGYATAATGPQAQLSQATPFSFVGASASLIVRETQDPTSTQLLQLTSPSGGLTFGAGVVQGVSCGQINIVITHGQTSALPIGTWYYDLLVTIGSQQVYYASGDFIVQGGQGGV